MKIFIVLSEGHLKVRKIAVYPFLISLLVPELNKDLKNDETKWYEKLDLVMNFDCEGKRDCSVISSDLNLRKSQLWLSMNLKTTNEKF